MKIHQHLSNLNPQQIARYLITFSWLYHGIFPKLLHIAPLEKTIMAGLGFNPQASYWLIKTAGIGEVTFGLLFWYFYQSKLLNYLNIVAMFGFIFAIAIAAPILLIEAFNPVTTNIAMIGFSLILLSANGKKGRS